MNKKKDKINKKQSRKSKIYTIYTKNLILHHDHQNDHNTASDVTHW